MAPSFKEKSSKYFRITLELKHFSPKSSSNINSSACALDSYNFETFKSSSSFCLN